MLFIEIAGRKYTKNITLLKLSLQLFIKKRIYLSFEQIITPMKNSKKTATQRKKNTTQLDQQCDNCYVFNMMNQTIASYHKLILEQRHQMVRNLTSKENINLN